MNDIQGIITAFAYDKSESIVFAPVGSVKMNKFGCIDLSVFIIIETIGNKKRNFTISLLHTQSADEPNRVEVQNMVLKEFCVNSQEVSSMNGSHHNEYSLLPEFNTYRSHVRFNLKNIPCNGPGTYTLILNNLSLKEIEKNPPVVVTDYISYYLFTVKE